MRRSLSRPTSVFRTIIVGGCKIFIQIPDRLRFGSTTAKNLFWSKNRERPNVCLAVNCDKKCSKIVQVTLNNVCTVTYKQYVAIGNNYMQ